MSSVLVGHISSVKNAVGTENEKICMVDNGTGPEKMVVIKHDIHPTYVMILDARQPYILAATDGINVEPIYLDESVRAGVMFNIKTKRIANTYIISGLTTNDKCEVCWDGVPLSTPFGTIKVSSLANAQICAL